jgi:hypothetical protein
VLVWYGRMSKILLLGSFWKAKLPGYTSLQAGGAFSVGGHRHKTAGPGKTSIQQVHLIAPKLSGGIMYLFPQRGHPKRIPHPAPHTHTRTHAHTHTLVRDTTATFGTLALA